MNKQNKPICITLVGMPGSGKTSWREGFVTNIDYPEDWVIISADDMIEDYAEENGLTYKAAFDIMKDKANNHIAAAISSAKMCNKNIIWDQTNVTENKRKIIIKTLPGYKHYLVSFLDVSYQTIMNRNAARVLHGRDIPSDIIDQMFESTCHVFGDDFEILPSNLSEVCGQFYD